MKPDQLYSEMRSLAEKLVIRVVEKTLKSPTIPVQSGDCVVRGDSYIYIDRRLGIWEKVRVLAVFLHAQATDQIFIKPAVREAIEKYGQDSIEIAKQAHKKRYR